MNEIISVIIPIYNVEKYLDRCVQSVVNQTYKDIEIILVDDGSPDNCPAQCDEWAKKDGRIKVIHKENGGVSSARNEGIACAGGKFLYFMDADDWLEPDCFETLIDEFDKNSQLLSFSAYSFDGKNEKTIFLFPSETIEGQENIKIRFIENRLNNVNCAFKLYLTEIIKGNSLLFKENYTIGEDYFFTYEYLNYVDSVKIIDKPLYHYDVSRESSAMHTKKDDYFRRWKVTEDIYNLEIIENVRSYIFKRMFNEIMLCAYESAPLDDKKEVFYETAKAFRKYYLSYFKRTSYISKPLLLLYLCPSLFRKYMKKMTIKYNREVKNG